MLLEAPTFLNHIDEMKRAWGWITEGAAWKEGRGGVGELGAATNRTSHHASLSSLNELIRLNRMSLSKGETGGTENLYVKHRS